MLLPPHPMYCRSYICHPPAEPSGQGEMPVLPQMHFSGSFFSHYVQVSSADWSSFFLPGFTVHRNAQHPSQVFRKNLCLIITPFSTSRPVQRDRHDHIRVPSPDFFLKIFHEFLTVQFPVSSLIVVFELIDRLIHRSFMVP